MKRTADELIELANEMESNDQTRNNLMDTLDDVFWESKRTTELDTILSDNRHKQESTKLITNFIKARVVDKVNLLSMLPDIKVDSPYGLGGDGILFAEMWMRVLLAWWKRVKMSAYFGVIGHYLSLRGTSVEQLYPNIKEKRIEFLVRDPKTVHAELKLSNPLEYGFVLFKFKATGRQILTAYPQARSCEVEYSKTEYDCIEYWDDDDFYLVVNDKKVPKVGIQHSLGFIPIRITPNIRMPGKVEGLSDVSQEIGLAENMNELLIMSTEELRERIYAKLVLTGEGWPNPVPTDRGAVLYASDPQAKAEYVSPVKEVSQVHQHLAAQDELFRVETGWPRQRSGIIDSAIWTGNAINASQSSVSDDVARTKSTIGQDIATLNEYYFKMIRRFFPSQEMVAYGSYKNKEYGFSFVPKDDLPDEFTHELFFSPLGHDIPTMIVNLLQLHGQKVLSLQTVLERIPGVNPAEELRRLEQDMQREIDLQKKLAMATQALAPAFTMDGQNLPPEQVEAAALAASKGGIA